MDFEYDGADDLGGRILWPRVAVLGGFLLLMFLFGRCTSGGGADPAQIETLQTEVATLTTTLAERDAFIAQLNQEILDLNAQLAGALGDTPLTGGTPDASSGDDQTTNAGPTSGQVYVVQAGDTLSDIAEAVYGDPLQFGVIATANGITDQNPLQVGQELQIPPNPDN